MVDVSIQALDINSSLSKSLFYRPFLLGSTLCLEISLLWPSWEEEQKYITRCGFLGHSCCFSSCSEVVQRSSYSCHPWLERLSPLSLKKTLSLRFFLPGIQGDSLGSVRDSDLLLVLQPEYRRLSDAKSCE